MKRWGSHIVSVIGYFVIGCIMGKWYNLLYWDAFTLMFWVLFVQWWIKFIQEVIEY